MVAMLAAVDARWPAFLILAIYIAMMVGIAVFASRRATSLNSFYLNDRGMGGWMSAFSYGTTYFSAVIFVGYAGQFGMSMGLASFWIGVANAAIGSCLAWIVLARRTKAMTRALNTKTMPEFFEKRYGSRHLKLLSSFVIFFFLIPYSTSVYQGLGYIIETVYGIPFVWCVVVMAVVTASYLFVGGYFASSLSDFIQGIVMIFGVGMMLIFMFNSSYVNWGDGVDKLTGMGFGFFPSYDSATGSVIDSPGFNLIVMCLLTSFGIWSLPQSVHKFYAVKNDAAIKKGIVISTLFALIIGGGAYLNGGLAHLFFDTAPNGNNDYVIVTMLQMAGFTPAMFGLIAVLVLSASMSTLSSLSLTGSSAISIDLYHGYINPKADDNRVKWLMRILCLVFIALSAVLAVLKIDAIVTLMSLSWGTIAGCFIGPYVYGLYSRKATAAGAYVSIVLGLVVTFALVLVFGFVGTPDGADFGTVIKKGIARSPLIGVITMATSMIVTPLVSLFTKKPSDQTVNQCFDALRVKD